MHPIVEAHVQNILLRKTQCVPDANDLVPANLQGREAHIGGNKIRRSFLTSRFVLHQQKSLPRQEAGYKWSG